MIALEKFKPLVREAKRLNVPIKDHNIHFVVENETNGGSYAENFPFLKPIRYAYLPRRFRVRGRMLTQDVNEIKKKYKKQLCVYNPNSFSNKSCLIDITSRVAFLKRKYTSKMCAKYVVDCVNDSVNDVTNNKINILLFYVDNTVLPKDVRYGELYSSAFIDIVKYKMLDSLNVDYVFIIKDGKRCMCLYNKHFDKPNYAAMLSRLKRYVSPKDIDIEEVPEEENKPNNGPERKTDTQDTRKKPESKKQKQPVKTRDAEVCSSELYKKYKDHPKLKNVSKTALKNRITSYLNSSDDIVDFTKDALSQMKSSELEKVVMAALSFSKTKNPVSLLYRNDLRISDEAIADQDKKSSERGFNKNYSIDPINDVANLQNFQKDNLSNVLSRRSDYYDKLKKSVVESITEPLEDSGYVFKDITITNIPEKDYELYKTVVDRINIKVYDKNLRKTSNISFTLPSLKEDRYVESGGLCWYYPSIISTVPIFVIKPKVTQFRSNYSSIRFTYSTFNKKEDVQVFVGAYKLPYIMLLALLKPILQVFDDYHIIYKIDDKPGKMTHTQSSLPLKDGKFLTYKIDPGNDFHRIIDNGLSFVARRNKFLHGLSEEDFIRSLKVLTKANRSEYVINQIKKYIIDEQIKSVLIEHDLPTDLYDICRKAAELAVSGDKQDKLSIDNIYLRTTDIINTAVEKGVHNAIAIHKQKRLFKPDAEISGDSGFVFKFFREQGVLQLLQQQNPVEEVSAFTSVRTIGPGGLPNKDSLQPKDRNLRIDHFGNIDPIDTPEGDPGSRLYLSTGHVYDDTKHAFLSMVPNDSNYDLFGPGTALTPFICKDDAVRANMAANQSRQTVPMINSEKPLVLSGYEGKIGGMVSSKFLKRSEFDGVVEYIDPNVVIIKDNDGKSHKLDVREEVLKSGSGMDVCVDFDTSDIYVGKKVKKHDILAKSCYFKEGLTQGINAKCCYLPIMGYSYEDGIVISESFAKKVATTHSYDIRLKIDNIDVIKKMPKIGDKFQKGDIIVSTLKEMDGLMEFSKTYEEIALGDSEIIDIKIYPVNREHYDMFVSYTQDPYDITNGVLKEKGLQSINDPKIVEKNIGKYTNRGDTLKYTIIDITVKLILSAEIGDKLTNRHAAKGVITKIYPDDQMVRTEDGIIMDIAINPLSVTSRMNFGQLHEMTLSKIMQFARETCGKLLNEKKIKECRKLVCKLYQVLDNTDGKKYSTQIIKNINNLPDIEFIEVANQLSFVAGPFQEPTTQQQIQAMELLGISPRSYMYIPPLGIKTKYPTSWGYMYIQRLEQISSLKTSSRNVGPYISTTMEPTRGKARAGGQRVGEMDAWAYLAYDAKDVIRDLWVVNGDHPEIKKEAILRLQKNGRISYNDLKKNVESGGAKSMYECTLLCMGLDPKS